MVTFEAKSSVSEYSKQIEMTWPILIDESRQLYKEYQMNRAGLWDLWGVPSWWGYLKQLFQGKLPQIPSADIHQRGGDVLIDPLGKIRLHHVGQGPADRPSIALILETVENDPLKNSSYPED